MIVEIRVSQARYEQAASIAATEHLKPEDIIAFWAEVGSQALAHPELTLQLLEVVLRREAVLDEDSPPRETLDRLWTALREHSRSN